MGIPSTPLLFFLLFSATIAIAITSELPILHTQHHPSSSSPLDSILSLAALYDPSRLAFLSQKLTSVPVASGQRIAQSSPYVLRAKLGSSPSQPLLLALDTSSDNSFVLCSPCSSCPPSTLFLPSNSSSYNTLPSSSPLCAKFNRQSSTPSSKSSPCTYTQQFGGNSSNFTATLSQDTLRLSSDIVPKFPFGCVKSVSGNPSNLPTQGLLGLGRGETSLLSQTSSQYHGVFSYCLPSFTSYYFSGSLRLGPAGQPTSLHYTPLLKNPHRPSLYYVNLTAVSVGKVKVAIPAGSFDFDPTTGAGTVVDSGTVITRFVAPAYAAVRDEFRRQVNAPSGYSTLGAFDTCFGTDEVLETPVVTLHLSGVELVLPVENTLVHSSARPLACLGMAAAPENVNSVVNVIASLQQQNLRVVVDVINNKVGFAKELCN